MRRVVALAVAAALLVAGCHTDDDRWDPNVPGAPSLRPAFGVRITDGKLQIWTGSRCVGVTRMGLSFAPNTAALLLESQSPGGVVVERFAALGPYPPGLEVTEAWPAGFDWHTETSLQFWVRAAVGGGSTTHLDEVVKESAQHPDDTYWFQGVGWLSPAEVAAKDGKTFLATCTPDPAKKG